MKICSFTITFILIFVTSVFSQDYPNYYTYKEIGSEDSTLYQICENDIVMKANADSGTAFHLLCLTARPEINVYKLIFINAQDDYQFNKNDKTPIVFETDEVKITTSNIKRVQKDKVGKLKVESVSIILNFESFEKLLTAEYISIQFGSVNYLVSEDNLKAIHYARSRLDTNLAWNKAANRTYLSDLEGCYFITSNGKRINVETSLCGVATKTANGAENNNNSATNLNNYEQPQKKLTEEEKRILDERIKIVIQKAEDYFRKGQLNLQDDKRNQARHDFDKAVETILISGLNVTANPRLREYYNQLIERIYRLEVPEISTIAKITPPTTSSTTDNLVSSTNNKRQQDTPQAGFQNQEFVPSINEELAKIESERTESRSEVGRIITIPKTNASKTKLKTNTNTNIKPKQLPDGRVPIVLAWINNNFNDPYSVKYLNWSKLTEGKYYSVVERRESETYWIVRVKLRAKNPFNAYILKTYTFYIKNNKVAFVDDGD